MPLTGPIPEGHSFFCPSCGALYAVTYSRPSSSDSTNKVCGLPTGHGRVEFNQRSHLQARSPT